MEFLQVLKQLSITLEPGITIFVIAGAIGSLFFTYRLYNENKELMKKKEDKKIIKENLFEDLKIGKESVEQLNNLVQEKFNYYLYKDILPVYVSSKTQKFNKEDFKKLKDKFYNDVLISVSPSLKKGLQKSLSPDGIGLLIHEKFGYLFNKVDSKFIGDMEPIMSSRSNKDEHSFFMS